MQKCKTSFISNIFKKSIWLSLGFNIKIGHKITVALITKGVDQRMKIISYTGVVLAFNKDKFNLYLTLSGVALHYNFNILLKLNALNTVRLFIHHV